MVNWGYDKKSNSEEPSIQNLVYKVAKFTLDLFQNEIYKRMQWFVELDVNSDDRNDDNFKVNSWEHETASNNLISLD